MITVIENNTLVDSNAAIALATEIERLEQVLKDMKGVLKNYVKTNGPVKTELEKWDNYPSVSYIFDREGTREIAKALIGEGIDPWELLKFSATDLRKQGWSDSAIESFGKVKITNRFSSRKL